MRGGSLQFLSCQTSDVECTNAAPARRQGNAKRITLSKHVILPAGYLGSALWGVLIILSCSDALYARTMGLVLVGALFVCLLYALCGKTNEVGGVESSSRAHTYGAIQSFSGSTGVLPQVHIPAHSCPQQQMPLIMVVIPPLPAHSTGAHAVDHGVGRLWCDDWFRQLHVADQGGGLGYEWWGGAVWCGAVIGTALMGNCLDGGAGPGAQGGNEHCGLVGELPRWWGGAAWHRAGTVTYWCRKS